MRLVVLLSFAMLLCATPAKAATCFPLATPGAAVEGVVSTVKRKHPTGAPLAGYIITLKSPVCLDDPDALDDVSKVRRIHVVPASAQDAAILQNSVGKRVRVVGSAISAHTSYHFAPIVLLDSSVQTAGGKS